MASQRTAILNDEMGLGKTAQAILGADLVGARKILVICPGVARENWVREFAMWQGVPRTLGALYTSLVMPQSDVIVVSFSMLTNLAVMRYLLGLRFDLLVIDEAHLLKNDTAGRSRSVFGNKFDRSRGLAANSTRVWELSGTIMPNHPGELWTHCRALFPEATRDQNGALMTYRRWTTRFCRTRRGSTKILGSNKETAADLVSRVRPHVLRRTMAQVQPDMPALRISQMVLRPDKLPPMTTEVAETAAIVAAAFATTSRRDTDEARRALAAVDEMHLASLRRWTGVAKAPAIAELIRHELESGLNKIVLFGLHREVFDILLKEIPGSVAIHGGVKMSLRQEIIDGFQGKVSGFDPRVLACHIDIASTALTLTAANNVGMAEQTWVVKDTMQAIKRVHRIGQKLPVLARIFSLAGSVDEKVGATLVRKGRDTGAFERSMEAA